MLPVYRRELTNSNYAGEAKQGGTVRAFWVSEISVSDYAGAWPESEWELLSQAESVMQIDQQKKFIFKVPDVRGEFNVLNLIDEGAKRAAQSMAVTIDSFIAGQHTAISANNFLGTNAAPITVGFGAGETRPSLFISRLRQEIIDASAPMTTLRAVVPTWFSTMLGHELAIRPTGLGDTAIRGAAGGASSPGERIRVYDVDCVPSQTVPNTAGALWKIVLGDPMISFAMAIENIETIRLQNDFSTGIKGLAVYGAKLFRGEYMALGTANQGAWPA